MLKGYGTTPTFTNSIQATPSLRDFSSDRSSSYITEPNYREILNSSIHSPLRNNTALYVTVGDDGTRVRVTLTNMEKNLSTFHTQNITVNVRQSGEEWNHARKIRIPASVAYKFLTPLQNKNKIIDWDTKIMKHLNYQFKGNWMTNHEIKNEPKARLCYEKKTGYKIVQLGSLVHPEVPWLICSLDGAILNQSVQESKVTATNDDTTKKLASEDIHTIEIKCPIEGKTQTVSDILGRLPYLEYVNECKGITLKKRHQYYCQVQLRLFVSKLSYCDFIIYSSFDDTCKMFNIVFDREQVLTYITNLQFVYFSKILHYIAKFSSDTDKNRKNNQKGSQNTALKDITNK